MIYDLSETSADLCLNQTQKLVQVRKRGGTPREKTWLVITCSSCFLDCFLDELQTLNMRFSARFAQFL